MTIFDIFKSEAGKKISNIGIGLGDLKDHNLKILDATIQFLKQNNSTIFFFGNKKAINDIKQNELFKTSKLRIELIEANEPENEIINFLNNKIINAAVRGNLSSNKFLENVKKTFNLTEINRLALLETYNGLQFFYGPVGIDECNTINNKLNFIKKAIKQLKSFNIEPKISILSGGRLGDVGRDSFVDNTINIANQIVEFIKREYPNIEIYHDEILIENAIEKQSNLIIAPDGISGNLIYRTLVHLGGGKAYGAVYLDTDPVLIDTSRVGGSTEIYGGLILALALLR